MLSPVDTGGLKVPERDPGNNTMCEGRKARPTPMDLRSIPAEVHAFESHPSHCYNFLIFKISENFFWKLEPYNPLHHSSSC